MNALNGKYALERRLGGGGMAEVFLAAIVGAEGFTRRVAVKRVLPGYSENPAFAQMFVGEARLSSRLQHPNVVSVLDFDRDAEGRLFLVMELVDGVDFDQLAQTGMLPFSAIIAITIEVLRGLGYAHEFGDGTDGIRGLVHRDVSPHNVLISWEGAVKVSDFGIAKARAASDATATEMIKGKPAYMSPEQANGEALDGRSDLFAVGIMLWELLCGRPLFAGDTMQETLARLLFAPVLLPSQLRPNVPPDLERIVMTLLARPRDQRYPTAEAAIADLVNCRDYPRDPRALIVSLLAERFPGRAPMRSRVTPMATPAATPPPMVTPVRLPRPMDAVTSPTTSRPTHARPKWPIVVALVGVAAIVTVIALVAMRGGVTHEVRDAAPIVVPVAAPAIDAGVKELAVDAAAGGVATAPAPVSVDAATTDVATKPVVESPTPVAKPGSTGKSPTSRPVQAGSAAKPVEPARDPRGSGIQEIHLGG